MMWDILEGKPRDYNEALRVSAEQVITGQHSSCLHMKTGKAIQTSPPLSACILVLLLTMMFSME